MKPLFTLCLLCVAVSSYAQPAVQWQKAYGSIAGDEGFNCVQQTIDGGYIAISSTTAGGEDVKGHHDAGPNGFDIWVVKLDSKGAINWSKCYGGSGLDMGVWIEQTPDTGYVFCGYTRSNDGDVSGNHGAAGDAWVVKLDDTGKIEWQTCYGGSLSDISGCIKPVGDDYILVGSASSMDGDLKSNKGYTDTWVLKLDASGTILWQKTFGGTGYEHASRVLLTKDGGYLLSGYTNSPDGDITGHKGDADGWLIKLNSSGAITWKKNYGGKGNEHLYDMIELPGAAGFLGVGHTNSNGGDITAAKGSEDVWVIKITQSGAIQWSKAYGGSLPDYGSAIVLGVDNNYIVAGKVLSADSQVIGMKGLMDGWLMSLDSNGGIIWQRPYGGSAGDNIDAMAKTADGGLVIAGTTRSEDGDATNSGYHKGGNKVDGWIVKLGTYAVGSSVTNTEDDNDIIVYPTVTSGSFNVKLSAGNNTLTVQMLDMQGRMIPVAQQQLGDVITVTPHNITPGIYLVKILVENEVHTHRVVYQP